jgi:hypothetical protein
MKAIPTSLFILASLASSLASPLPYACKPSSDRKSSLFPTRNHGDVAGQQAPLGDKFDISRSIEDFFSIATDPDDDDDFDAWPTPIDPADVPISTTELMQMYDHFSNRALPAAPTPTPSYHKMSQGPCQTSSRSRYYEIEWDFWTVAVVGMVMIGVLFVGMVLVEIMDAIWTRFAWNALTK